MGSIKCFFRGLYNLIRYGIYVPHIYIMDSFEPSIVIATDKYFRQSASLAHSSFEKVYPDAVVITYKCDCCGKESKGWVRKQNLPLFKEDWLDIL